MTALLASFVFALTPAPPDEVSFGDDEHHAEQHRGTASVSVAALYALSGAKVRGPGVMAGGEVLRWDHVALAIDGGFLAMHGVLDDALTAQYRGWLAPTLRLWVHLGRARLEGAVAVPLLLVSTSATTPDGTRDELGGGVGVQGALGLSVVVFEALDVFLRGFGQLSGGTPSSFWAAGVALGATLRLGT